MLDGQGKPPEPLALYIAQALLGLFLELLVRIVRLSKSR
jgi:hypothetical protein